MFTQKLIKIFHSVQEIGLFSLFQNLNLGNASANPKWHLTNSWATSCQYQCLCKILSKYSKRFKSYRHFSIFFTNRTASFSLFRIWTSATPWPILNDIWQSLGLHLVNINAYAKFYQNIPNGLKFIDIFRHFSQTGRRQNLHKLSVDKIKCLIIGHTKKVNFQLTFLRVVQLFRNMSVNLDSLFDLYRSCTLSNRAGKRKLANFVYRCILAQI